MATVLVLYYSSHGHTESMAYAAQAGAQSVDGVTAHVKRVPETVPDAVAQQYGFKTDQDAPIAEVDDLKAYDALILGTPTRYGRMCNQMTAFWDQTGGLWKEGALNGKIAGSFVSTGSQHGGQEMTHFSAITNLLHMGYTIVGLPYSYQGQMESEKVIGCSPYGASTIAGGKGQLRPTDIDLGGMRHQAQLIAELATAKFG